MQENYYREGTFSNIPDASAQLCIIEENEIVGDRSESMEKSLNISQILQTFDGSPKYDGTLVSHISESA